MCSLAASFLSKPGSTQAQKIERMMSGIHHLLLRTPMSSGLQQAKRLSRWTALGSLYASVMLSVGVCLMPSIKGLFTPMRSLFPRLPIPLWPPPCHPDYDWCENFLMTFEVSMLSILCMAYGCFSTIHVCSLVYLAELLRVPAMKLRSTLQSASDKRPFFSFSQISSISKYSDKCWKNTDQEVNLIISYQHEVIGLIDQYNECFAGTLFIRQFFSVLFLAGSSLLFMTDPTNFQAISITIFTICSMFTFAFWGDKLSHANDKMLWAVYDSGWENLSPQLRVKLCLILCRANRPIGIRGKYLGFLTYQSFLQLVRWSYNLLQFLFQL
ncbi:Odorant receptor 2a [Frankliniella fusca]|uniref:Odorant receptor 2a n=1 Tax=Frankliniella fusca TaxID=407009 RepID=A0AAE1LQ50_9NEOP|nr:Odorant receptor 2a [Frankliniella fusca]